MTIQSLIARGLTYAPAPVRHKIMDWALKRKSNCKNLNTQLRNNVSTVLSYGEHATAATLTTLGYGFLRLRNSAFIPSCPSSDGKLVSLARMITSSSVENSAPLPISPTQVVAIPTLTLTALTCVAALTVSATDVYFRNYAETQKKPIKSLKTGFWGLFKTKKKQPEAAEGKVDKLATNTVKAITKFDTLKAKKLKDVIAGEVIRIVPGLLVNSAWCYALGFAVHDVVLPYLFYRLVAVEGSKLVKNWLSPPFKEKKANLDKPSKGTVEVSDEKASPKGTDESKSSPSRSTSPSRSASPSRALSPTRSSAAAAETPSDAKPKKSGFWSRRKSSTTTPDEA